MNNKLNNIACLGFSIDGNQYFFEYIEGSDAFMYGKPNLGVGIYRMNSKWGATVVYNNAILFHSSRSLNEVVSLAIKSFIKLNKE